MTNGRIHPNVNLPHSNSYVDTTFTNLGSGPPQMNLSAGERTVVVYLREDGARLDKLTLVQQ